MGEFSFNLEEGVDRVVGGISLSFLFLFFSWSFPLCRHMVPHLLYITGYLFIWLGTSYFCSFLLFPLVSSERLSQGWRWICRIGRIVLWEVDLGTITSGCLMWTS